MTPDIFDLVALVIIFLCYCAGRYWLGPSDAKKASIKHDGRRALYRGGILALVLAFIVWRTTYGFWPAVLTWVSGCLAGSIGVRLGWNAARGLDWRYLGSTSLDDVICVLACMWGVPMSIRTTLIDSPNYWYGYGPEKLSWFDQKYVTSDVVVDFKKLVHRAGLIRTIVEGAVSVGGYALILFA